MLNQNDLAKGEEEFAAARERLLKDGGGIVSVIYHPCEFVHRQFWDGVNFKAGANRIIKPVIRKEIASGARNAKRARYSIGNARPSSGR